jgi:hypothetical protein
VDSLSLPAGAFQLSLTLTVVNGGAGSAAVRCAVNGPPGRMTPFGAGVVGPSLASGAGRVTVNTGSVVNLGAAAVLTVLCDNISQGTPITVFVEDDAFSATELAGVSTQ